MHVVMSSMRNSGDPHYCLPDRGVDKLSGSQMMKPMMIMMWKSDRLIVVKKPANNRGKRPWRSRWSEGGGQRGNHFNCGNNGQPLKFAFI